MFLGSLSSFTDIYLYDLMVESIVFQLDLSEYRYLKWRSSETSRVLWLFSFIFSHEPGILEKYFNLWKCIWSSHHMVLAIEINIEYLALLCCFLCNFPVMWFTFCDLKLTNKILTSKSLCTENISCVRSFFLITGKVTYMLSN